MASGFFILVKRVSSGPRWFIWSPRFYSKVFIVSLFTFRFYSTWNLFLFCVWCEVGVQLYFIPYGRAVPAQTFIQVESHC